MRRFGEKLRHLRTKSDLTLKELATRFGFTSHGYLSEIESGKKKPTLALVLKVSSFFHISTDELLKDELEVREE